MTDSEIAKEAGLTVPGVRYKRERGWSDEEIISGARANQIESFTDAQRRKESALADLRETERDEKRGSLIPLSAAMTAWAQLVQITRMKLSSLPNALCEQLAAMTDPTEVRLFLIRETDRCANQLADEFLDASTSALAGGGEGDAPADPADGDGVGGE